MPSKAAAEPLADGTPAGRVDDHVVRSVAPPRVVIPGHTAIQDQQHERERQRDPQEPPDQLPPIAWRKRPRSPDVRPLHRREIPRDYAARHISVDGVARSEQLELPVLFADGVRCDAAFAQGADQLVRLAVHHHHARRP